jgi:nucleotide-binding universal stress UspA family protein
MGQPPQNGIEWSLKGAKMTVIAVAYDGSPHSEDALAFAKELSHQAGAELALLNVYRADPPLRWPSMAVRGRSEFLRKESRRLLERTAQRFALQASLYPLAGTTTASAVKRFAEEREPALIVFGSAFNAPPGAVHPGSAARRLLQSGPVALAFAPAGYHKEGQVPRQPRVGYAHDDPLQTARQTAALLAGLFGGSVAEGTEAVDLLVLGSAPNRRGLLHLGAQRQEELFGARVPTVVVPPGKVPALAAVQAAA